MTTPKPLAAATLCAILVGCSTYPSNVTPCQRGRAFKGNMFGDWAPLLFFARGSSELSPRSLTLLSEYVFRACHSRTTNVEIVGSTDTSELAFAGGHLGQQRAEAVAALLPSLGFYPEKVAITDYGSSHPLVPTKANVSEPQNRLVTMIFR